MSQTSSTPRHVQSDDSRPHQSLLDEIQRLKGALGRAQREIAMFKEDCEKERAEKYTLRIDLDELRSSSHGTSSDQISVQYWQDRAEKAERRAEEAKRHVEEAEHRAEEAKLEVYKMRNVNFPRLITSIYRVFAKEMGQALDPGDEESVPEDEGEVDRQMQAAAEEMGLDIKSVKEESVPEDEGEADRLIRAIAQASEDEEIDYQGQQSEQAGKDEEIDYLDQQSGQASEGENEEHSSTHNPDQEITVEEYAARQAYDESSMRYRGTQESGPSPTYDPDTFAGLEDNSQYGSSKIRVPFPLVLDSGSPEALSIRDLERTSSQPLSPPPPSPPSTFSQPQQSPSFFHLRGKTTRPSDQDTPSADDTGSRTNALETLGDMQEALPTLSGSSKPKKHDFPDLPKGSPQIPGIPSESTAPPIPKRPTPTPAIHVGGWDLHGTAIRKRIHPSHDSFFEGWPAMPEIRPMPRAMDSVAAGKQPERPIPANEAPSVTGVDPPKPTSTISYAGTTQALPPKVQETAQSSRTVLKPGNVAAKAAVTQTDAPPADQADQADNTLGFQTVPPRKNRGSSGRGGGASGQGEAGSKNGGHQGSKFGQFQYHGRGGQGGNQKGGDRRGGNQNASQGQART